MLTRDEILAFVDIQSVLSRLLFTDIPWCFRVHRLVAADDRGHGMLTPAGRDLLATIPHLTAPEPEPAPPSCSRCGGETEVPVFMGPLMTPCPACSNDDGSPKRTAHANVDDEVIDASYTIERPPGDGWVRVTDEPDGGNVYFDDAFIFWDHRGNVHFRPVAE